jgi:hypothetical protein
MPVQAPQQTEARFRPDRKSRSDAAMPAGHIAGNFERLARRIRRRDQDRDRNIRAGQLDRKIPESLP